MHCICRQPLGACYTHTYHEMSPQIMCNRSTKVLKLTFIRDCSWLTQLICSVDLNLLNDVELLLLHRYHLSLSCNLQTNVHTIILRVFLFSLNFWLWFSSVRVLILSVILKMPALIVFKSVFYSSRYCILLNVQCKLLQGIDRQQLNSNRCVSFSMYVRRCQFQCPLRTCSGR